MTHAHARYAQDRWDLMNVHDQDIAIRHNWTYELRTVGVAGLRDVHQVKCLHTHYADYLASKDNILGKWVHDELTLRYGS